MTNSRLKFRAWDKYANRMLYSPQGLHGLHEFFRTLAFLEKNKIIVMQCTGLTDKNGKDIYENDILRIDKDFQNLIGGTTENVLVGFKDGCFMYARSSYDPYYLNTYLWMAAKQKYCEIIGNVHENKELLK